ncbi:telomerase protein component 1 [Sphaeramia orbicularis]|uniref:telomerase protein component 1 n=1 Tax=Sphaeramia orbicularis TaxID=375764 RepID=UPI0011805610|nr:telomerase protein component 1 [Sphaeramia orbicularis]
MKALTLQQTNVAPGAQQQASYGRSLSSNYAPPNLENKFLTQASPLTLLPSCPSLQPSRLSSTTSTLLSTSSCSPSISSSLLSTQNRLLKSESPPLSFSLTSADTSLVSTSLAGTALSNRFAHSLLIAHPVLVGEDKTCDEEDNSREETPVSMQSCGEDNYVSEEDDVMFEAESADAIMALPALEAEIGDEEDHQPMVIRQEEFAQLERKKDTEGELKEKKYLLLNAVCCSLINKATAPGQTDWDKEDSTWTRIMNLAKEISPHDPQFLLKVAVYTRQELNIRITANFLLALAANLPSTKTHVRRYFCAAVQLPSDWLEVVRIYSTCFSRSLPMCLKKAMTDKFKQFSEYQLAKYNTRKHRCKHSRNRGEGKKPTPSQLKDWADLLRSNESILQKYLKVDQSKVVVDKKQSEFSMKKMIKRLHIKEPAEHVMAILGKKYPADVKAFTRSGIKGTWEREKAGKRMKLQEPETWERLLSREGNKAATWEKLIDNNSLPFMAMLRNLRNMITQGISEAHHNKILRRLTNKKAVIQSRQFPFRFLAAYKVIMELQTFASATKKPQSSVKEILKGILKKIPQSRKFRRLDWATTAKSRMKVTLRVPFVFRQYRLKKAQLMKNNQKLYSVDLLKRYRQALETAVHISCRYNVPPLPGRTAILFCDFRNSKMQNQDFCLPPDPEEEKKRQEEREKEEEEEEEEKEEEEEEEEKPKKPRRRRENDDPLSPSMLEVAVLLSLMIGSSAEDSWLYLVNWCQCQEVKLKSDVLLENVRTTVKQVKDFENLPYEERGQYKLSNAFTKQNKVDTIIVIAETWVNGDIEWVINNYRKDVNNKVLIVKIFLSQRHVEYTPDSNTVELVGFSEQLLRFVAERGSSRLLDHVEHLDKLHNIPPPEGAKDSQTTNRVVSIPPSPNLRWRGVRVFVSSTFRDMHAERDILVRSVFPELRRRAAPHCLYLQEVELRWGVTEEESGRAAELCLSEVCRSQMLVGILGERYGLIPPKPVLPDLPQYAWLESAPAGLSITEMEIRQFEALYPDTAHQRMFCYFRDPNITKSVPVAWRSDFASESKEAESKMTSLKTRLRESDVKVTENYSCEWGGVVEGKPYLKNLEDFRKAVLDDIWTAVMKQFVEEDDKTKNDSDVTEQEAHQGALQRQFFGRAKLLSGAVAIVEQAQVKGGMMVMEGGPGEGKTVFMAALANALRSGSKSSKKLICDVLSYSTAASQSARSVENLLRCLNQWLRKMKDNEDDSPLPQSYQELLSEFHSSLSDLKKSKPLVLLVDGVDLLQDSRGQLSSDWIPQKLPPSVCLVVSIVSHSALLQTLAKRRGALLFTLGQLTMPDRREIVQKGLDAFGKKLSDSAFNNQLQTLIMKKGAVSPMYLHLACEDLRNFASFDKLKESLQELPPSLSQLVQYSLDRLCLQHRGMLGLRWALAALTVSATGLKERDLYAILNTCNNLNSQDRSVTWDKVLDLSRKPRGRIPMANFTRVVQSLQSLIDPSKCHDTNDLLVITNPEVKRAFEDFLLPAESDRNRAHLILAAHQWALADPQGTETFLHCEANSVMHLPSNLMKSKQLEAVHSLLSSYYFLYANVRHGLLHHILEIYSLYDKKHTSAPTCDLRDSLEDCRSFLQRHATLLSSWPALFIQQAFNELPESSAHTWAQGLMGKGGVRVVKWLNNKNHNHLEMSELLSTFSSEPTCLVVSPDGQLMVVGTGQGTLHFIHTQTGQEVKTLMSNCDGISSCIFLKDGRLVSTSFDGQIETWDVGNGCRTACINGHTNAITASDITADKKHLVTVSLDFMLKVWSSAKGKEVAALPSTSPLNCVTFDPEGHLLAAGCWNGKVIVWNWFQNKTLTSLSGHQRSVRSLSFSPSSSMLCSGSVSGEVRVWSVPTSTCVGLFQAHSGATEALTFLDAGRMLLSAGSDHTLQLWSGGLGRSVTALKNEEQEQEPPQKKLKSVSSELPALCVAVNEDFVAVGYHRDGVKLYSIESGEKIWASSVYNLSVLCLMWVIVDAEQKVPELLVTGGNDRRLRIWKKKEGEEGMLGGLTEDGMFGTQSGPILALAQSSTYLASASDDGTVVLWLLSDLISGPDLPHALLKGHSGGVTCVAFSPDGGQLLSGSKDQTLKVWDVSSSPPVLSKSIPHAHRDWITGCVWTPDSVMSSSNDGRLCLWDLEAGQSFREISWKSPLTSICCVGHYVISGCAEGALHVWNWETSVEICHITAHQQRIHHCCLLQNKEDKEIIPEDMTVLTASDDGMVQVWKPLQVEHFATFQGHSGGIHGVVLKEGVPEFVSVSEDCSLRCWTWTTESPPSLRGPVTALCFSQKDDLLLVGYEFGLLELWQHNTVVGHKQASDSPIRAICSIPDGQFAVSSKLCVELWKLVWNRQHGTASLVKVSTYSVEQPTVRLVYCSVLVGISASGIISAVSSDDSNIWQHTIHNWHQSVRILGQRQNDEKSVWLVGEQDREVTIGFMFAMGPKTNLNSAFSAVLFSSTDDEKNGPTISAITLDNEFVVCGDVKGNMWFNQPPELSSWSSRKPAHSDRVSVLRLTGSTIVSASHDRTVKLWDRNTKKQTGMFVCGGPVVLLEVNPEKPTELVCCDNLGKLYFLSWDE